MNPPIFVHDCRSCHFLGRVEGPDPWNDEEESVFDLYFCSSSTSFMGGSLIARYGNEGSEYMSSPRSLLQRDRKHHPALMWGEALLDTEERKKEREKTT